MSPARRLVSPEAQKSTASSEPSPPATSPLTVRAVCLGLFLTTVIDLFMLYNDYYLENTLLIGSHFPTVSIVIIALMALLVNPLLRAFSSGELLLIWSMIGVGGGICGAGLMRYLPSWILAPAYYTTQANGYATYLLKYIPDWMLVSKDPSSM